MQAGVAAAPVTVRTVDIAQLIDGARVSAGQVWVFVLCGLIAMLDGFDLQIAGSLAPVLAKTFGVPVSAFGAVFAAGFFGIMVGSLAMGPIADRVGRKGIVVAAMLLFGVFTLVVPLLDRMGLLGLGSFLVCRFVAGLGVGGVMPNVLALTAEYAPRRARAFIVNTMYCGVPLGSVMVGLLTAALVPQLGWQAVFEVGGVLPIALALVSVAALPESARYLAGRGARQARISALLRRMLPGEAVDPGAEFILGEGSGARTSLRRLLQEGRVRPTLLLWLAMFLNLLIIVFVLSWLPAVMHEAGLEMRVGVLLAAMFSLGGMAGSVIVGRLIDRFGASLILVAAYVLAAAAVAAYGLVGGSVPSLYLVTIAAGATVIGAQSGVTAFAAGFYPTLMRSTGLGWALGIGRLGSIIGPALGGVMLARHWPVTEIFLAAAFPALLAAGTIVLIARLSPEQSLERV